MVPFCQRRSSVPDWFVVRLTLVLMMMSQRHLSLVLSHDEGAGTCSSWPPPCSQVCSGPSVNDALCSCKTGFYLAADERHCHANQSTSTFQPTGRSAFLLYNSGVDIMAVAFDSILSSSSSSSSSVSSSSSLSSSSSPANLTPTTIYEGTPQLEIANFAMALEISKGRIFFGNGEELVVRMMELESRTTSDFLVNGLNLVSSMTLDWVTSVLYVSDVGLHKIFACSASTGQCSEIMKVHLAFSMDIDAINGKLYWSECSLSGRIESSYLDGSGRKTVKPDDSCPRSLKLDHPTQTLYWVNFADDQIHMYDLSTEELRLLPANDFMYSLNSVAVFEDDLIWTTSLPHYSPDDRDQDVTTIIHNTDKFSISEILEQANTIVGNIPKAPVILQVWHSAMQVPGANPCVEKQCSHLCFQSMSPGDATCACPSGMVLGDDQRSCTIDWSMPSIVFAKRNELHFVGVDFVGGKAGETFFRVGEVETITALAFDYSTKTIYLSVGDAKGANTSDDRNQAQGTIMRIDLNENPYRGETMFSTTSTVTDLEVDWLSKNIYWVDHDAGTIEIASIDGLSQAVLTGDDGSGVTEKPRAIAVDPREKKLFYSDCGRNPHLGSCDLAGRHCKSMALRKGECVTDLLLDHTDRKIYFVLGSRIMVTDLDLRQLVLHRHRHRPNSLATLMNQLYWTDDSDIRFTVDSSDANDERIRVGKNQTGLLGPLIVFSDSEQPKGVNRCGSDRGGCSDICLENKSHNVTCLCQTGNSLNADGITCNGDTKRSRQALQRIQKKQASTNAMAHALLLKGQFSAVGKQAEAQDAVSVSPSFRGMLTSIQDVTATFFPCPCRNGGSCESGNGFVKCLCPSGFAGGFCDEREEPSVKSSTQLFKYDFLIYVGAALGAMTIVIATLVAIICVVRQRSRCSAVRRRDDEVQIKSPENSAYEMGCVDDSTSVSSGQKKARKQKK